MTELFNNGFEEGNFSAWSSTSGSPVVVTTNPHHGTYDAEFDANGELCYKDFAGQTTVFARTYVRLNSQPPSDNTYRICRVLRIAGDGNTITHIGFLRRATNALALELRTLYPTALSQYYNFDWESDTYYCVELKFVKAGGTAGEYRLYLNGVEVLNRTGVDTSGAPAVSRVLVGELEVTTGWTVTVNHDCVVVADTYIGTEAVLMEVTDSLSLADLVLSHKTFGISDIVSIADSSLTNKNILVADFLSLSDEAELFKGLFDLGHMTRIWMKGVKVFAGVIEEVTPEEGGVLHARGRCFGQKLMLRTKNKTFNKREVSLGVKDLVEDLSEVSTLNIETPSPTVTITKDLKYEYIWDGLTDLAKQAGSDWEFKLGMGHDLRFRSRNSNNVPTVPTAISEVNGHILVGGRKETDGYSEYNKVTVLGGELSNIDNDLDKYTDEGDIGQWNWQAFNGGTVFEDSDAIAAGKVCIFTHWNDYVNEMTSEFDLGSSGIDISFFKYVRFMHKTDQWQIEKYPSDATFYFQLRLRDTSYRNATRMYLGNNTQPPQNFAEIMIPLAAFEVEDNFDWQHVRWVQFRCISDRSNSGEGVRGGYYIDRFYFHAPNVTKSVTATNDFQHTREYVYRDEKLLDPDFVAEVANALLNILKNKENRYRLLLAGIPTIQVGHKVTVNSPTWGLNGTYYICEVQHKLSSREGYVTEVVLESPSLTLEALLSQSIQRQIKRLERGGVS